MNNSGSMGRLVTCAAPPPVADLDPGDKVICADGPGIDAYRSDAAAHGIDVRTSRYRYQAERVVQKTAKRRVLIAQTTPALGHSTDLPAHAEQEAVDYATAAFTATWDALSEPLDTNPTFTDASTLVPVHWLSYLPFPTLNPAQAQTAPVITGTDRSVVVTAPTGAGKTVIGMLAVLKAILDKDRKAAWLVPQRSLTAELNRELDAWRAQGLKVVALSGEHATDAQATKDADLWVATTEKFEALCRTSSMRETIAAIDTIVVDEIHLLGEPSRGAVLETVLARVSAAALPVRIVGLSATAANADSVADWLNADLLPITWRPTRQTQQMLTIPAADADYDADTRNAVCCQIVSDVVADNGSVLVFCGTKAKVRSAAVALAQSRGVDTDHVDLADPEQVHQVCQSAGVGVHYADWPHKNQAEADFRTGATTVLVATSTLAAGVNLPARAVIVRDTSIGPAVMEVSTVQQMFGRAGRAGKEPEGWSFLIGDTYEIGHWRKALHEGYAIQSGLLRNLADHLLSEVVQRNITTLADADQWWRHTFAHHEGAHSTTQLDEATELLEKFGFVSVDRDTPTVDTYPIQSTQLGRITSRMMVSVKDAARVIMGLSGDQAPTTPTNIAAAEDTLVRILSERVEALMATSATAAQGPMVRRIVDARGVVANLAPADPTVKGVKAPLVSQAGLLLALRSPHVFTTRGGQILGVNRALFTPAVTESPRMFAWLAAIGPLGKTPAWASAVAQDLGGRVTWHHLQPERGDGRLLAACERAVPRPQHGRGVPELFNHARDLGVGTPDRLVAAGGRWKANAAKVAEESAHISKSAFSSGVVGFVTTADGGWTRLPAAESFGRRLAVGFHRSGDIVGNKWLGR